MRGAPKQFAVFRGNEFFHYFSEQDGAEEYALDLARRGIECYIYTLYATVTESMVKPKGPA